MTPDLRAERPEVVAIAVRRLYGRKKFRVGWRSGLLWIGPSEDAPARWLTRDETVEFIDRMDALCQELWPDHRR